MKTIDDVSLNDLLPYSIKDDANVKAIVEAIDPQLRAFAKEVDTPSLYVNIDKLPSLVLDHLAVQYDVSAWRDSWSVELKRKVLKNAIADKRKVGTKSAVLNAISSFGSAASIVEWWEIEPKGEPHTFTVYVNLQNATGAVTDEAQEDVMLLLDNAKPARSHYTMVIADKAETGINFTAIMRPCIFARI